MAPKLEPRNEPWEERVRNAFSATITLANPQP